MQQSFEVIGGQSLKGTLTPQGAKNEALQVLCAVLLTKEKVTISNVPNILDVRKSLELLKGLGVNYHPKLPDTVASHFNGSGEADGFSSKLTHSITMVCLQAGMVLMFLILGFALKKLPTSMVNIPNKDYWFAPERKDETITKVTAAM